MSQNDVQVRSAILETNEKQPDRFLFVGKFESQISQNDFLFYLFEVLSPWTSSVKLKKVILDSIQKNFVGEKTELDLDLFENILQNLNQTLNNFAQKTESSWVGNLNGVIGFVKKNEINIAQTGKILGYIFRKGKISAITDNSYSQKELHPLKTFSDITSGGLAMDDRIVIGNIELFNHLSLDRIRRILENQSAKEALEELYRGFKKAKIFAINSILMETKDINSLESEVISTLPDTLSLGQPDEDLIKTLRKKYSPIAKNSLEIIARNSKLAGKGIFKHSKIFLSKTKEKWNKRDNTKTKEFLGKTGQFVSEGLNSAQKKLKPQIEKIKVNDRYKKIKVKTFPYAGKTTSGLSKIVKIVGLYLSSLKVLFLPQNRKYLYGILVVVLLTMGYLKVRANNSLHAQQKKQQEIVLYYDKAKEAFDKAKEDQALGRTTDTKQFYDALDLAVQAEQSNSSRDKAIALEKDIKTAIDKITKTTRLFGGKADIAYKDSPKKIILIGSDIFSILSDGKIYSTNTEDKVPHLLASIGKEKGEVASLAYSSSENKLFIETGNNSVLVFDIKTKTQSELKITDSEETWETAKSIASFSTNLYLLDSDLGQIWKHTETDGGYSKGSAYTSAKSAGINGAVDFAVDGNLFVLKGDGQVAKFSRGTLDQNFSIKNISAPKDKIETPIKIFTDADTNYIFILDRKENRVIKFDKSSGAFINQYTIDGSQIDDFVVNTKIQKLWFLSGSNLFKIDL